jgi:hypothetical protein
MRSQLSAFLSVVLVCDSSSIAGAQSAQRIATIGWLAGCLEMRKGERVVEEHPWVEGTMNGTMRRIEFPYARVPCPTAR